MNRPRGGNWRGASLLFVVLVLTAASWGVAVTASAEGSLSPPQTPSPTEAPSLTQSPSPTGSPTTTGTPTATTDPTSSPSLSPVPTTPSTGPTGPVSPAYSAAGARARADRSHDHMLSHAEGGRRHRHRDWRNWAPDPRWGTYGTARLDRAAAKLRRNGRSEERIATALYTPFIVEGPATWSDSWGAPRWVGGYHPHHGQDVLCGYGAPVLAVDRGEIVFGNDPLGGRVAYLTKPDGAFWYYAHLKGYAHDLESHDRVRPGRVIGYCGASGDATVPHVHFAFFDASRRAVDPMPALVAWLDTAERRLGQDERRRGPLPDAVSLLRPLHPLLDRAVDEPGLIEVPAPPDEGPIPPKARALGVAAVLCLAGASVGATGRRRKNRGDEETGSVETAR
jgi:murein DD-endopeptidase MepM/ murein hydrolase activator NlpD